MDLRSDSLPGGVSHSVTVRRSEGWPLVPAEDTGPKEDLCDGLELHPPWTRDFLDLVSRGGGDAKEYYHSSKPAGGDRSFSLKGIYLVSISIHLLILCITEERVLLIVIVFIIGIVVVLLLLWLLLSGCALGCWAPQYHQLDHKGYGTF
jgi:hypothetical protein